MISDWWKIFSAPKINQSELMLAKWKKPEKTVHRSRVPKHQPNKIAVMVNQLAGIRRTTGSPETSGDLVIRVKYSAQVFETTPCSDLSSCPKWNEIFEFDLEFGHLVVEIVVVEKFVFLTETRGRAVIPIASFSKLGKIYRNSYRLYGRRKSEKLSACIGLGVQVWNSTTAIPPKQALDWKDEPEGPKSTLVSHFKTPFDLTILVGIIKRPVFNLNNTLKGSGCEAYLDVLVASGFDDRGAFANLSDQILIDDLKIYNVQHRGIILDLCSQVKRTNLKHEIEKRVQPPAPGRMSIDGTHFYSSMRGLEDAHRESLKPVILRTPSQIEEDKRIEYKRRMREREDTDIDTELTQFHTLAAMDMLKKEWAENITRLLPKHRLCDANNGED